VFRGQHPLNALLGIILVVVLVWFALRGHPVSFILLIALSLLIGFLLILPIGVSIDTTTGMSAPPIGRISRKPIKSDSAISRMKLTGWPRRANHTKHHHQDDASSALSDAGRGTPAASPRPDPAAWRRPRSSR